MTAAVVAIVVAAVPLAAWAAFLVADKAETDWIRRARLDEAYERGRREALAWRPPNPGRGDRHEMMAERAGYTAGLEERAAVIERLRKGELGLSGLVADLLGEVAS